MVIVIISDVETLRTLKQCLLDTELARLRVIARLWGLELTSSRSLEIAAELAQCLADPKNASEAWDALAEEERTALHTLLTAGGLMPTETFTRRYGKIRPIGPGRLESEMPWRKPIGPAEALWFRGFIFEGFGEKSGEAYPVLFVPPELREALPIRPAPVASRVRLESVAPPAHRYPRSVVFLDDLTTVLSFVHNEIVRPHDPAPGAWSDKVKQRLMSFLRDRDVARLDFMLNLIDHLGWTRVDADGRLRLVAEPVVAWLQEELAASRMTLVEGWLKMPYWVEMFRLTTLQPDESDAWRYDPTFARAALCRHIEPLVSSEWVRMDDWINAVKTADPDFQRPGGDYDSWYVRDGPTGVYLNGFESWDQVEGVLLRALLNGPACWLGLVEVGGKVKGAAPDVFRPTPSEIPMLDAPLPTVGADMTVTMPAQRRFERFQLARVGDLSRVRDPYVYRLTPNSMNRARQQRIDLEKVLEFLAGLNEKPLPASVRSSLTRWFKNGTEVWLQRTVLLRVADKEILEQILASPKTGRYVDRRIGAQVAIVLEKDWPKLSVALAELGFLVDLVGIEGAHDEH